MHSIETGKYHVIGSGIVILYDRSTPAIFSVTVEENFAFQVEIVFVTDKNNEKRQMKRTVIAGKDYIKFECINFDNPLGTGTMIPIKLAKHQDKIVSMHLWSFLLGSKGGEGTRKIEYSFYIEKERGEQDAGEGEEER